VRLKDALTTDGGAQYWESIKGAVIPPEDKPAFRGIVISQEGLHIAKSVVLGIVDAKVAEVTLTFDPPSPARSSRARYSTSVASPASSLPTRSC